MSCIGWDIGGAHVKAVVLKPSGEITDIFQQPCPLWKGLEYLRQSVNTIRKAVSGQQYAHAVTMTGELVDLFASREDGVRQIIETMQQLLGNDKIAIFAGQQGLLEISKLEVRHYLDIASANWLASACFATRKMTSGLFVDIGSTTTDILLLKEGEILAKGYTDYQRLRSRELVYTGIVRTPVMAVTQTVLDGDYEIGVMAEFFATMADVYRLTGELNEAYDQIATADGAEKTLLASARRLSRMIGCDFYPEELSRWRQFAANVRAQQLATIQSACMQVAAADLANGIPLIGAGVGRFLVEELAERLACPYLDFSELCACSLKPMQMSPADCAPAVSVAHLLLEACK